MEQNAVAKDFHSVICQDAVKVKLLGVQPTATGAPDADGVIRWRVDLAPGATRTLQLRYQITRPKDWQLYQN